MNERIFELADEALELTPKPWSPHNLLNEFCKKFAELIIKECVDAAEEAQADFYVVYNIKSRFGLAEFQNERTS